MLSRRPPLLALCLAGCSFNPGSFGPGGSMQSVQNGINYVKIGTTLAAFGVASLATDATTVVQVIGSRGVIFVSQGAVILSGKIDVSALPMAGTQNACSSHDGRCAGP